MFERFTDRARGAVVLAQEEAGLLGHNHIGTEHLLLGLLHQQSGLSAQVLEAAGITLDAARVQVEEIVGVRDPPAGHIPFTPRAKKVLELSLREALELKSGYIGTEHLLLGVISDSDGVAGQVLQRLGPPLPELRQRVIEAARGAQAVPLRQEEEGEQTGIWSLAPFPRLLGVSRPRPQVVIGFRQLLLTVDRRLARIERRLDVATDDRQEIGTFPGLVASVERRLGNIERHLDIAADVQPARKEADDPPAQEEPDDPPEREESAELVPHRGKEIARLGCSCVSWIDSCLRENGLCHVLASARQPLSSARHP